MEFSNCLPIDSATVKLGLRAYISGYIPVRGSNSQHSTLSTTQQQTAVTSIQSFQVTNAKMIEDFIEELPPISVKRQKKHRTILTHVSNWWVKKPFIETTKLDLKNIVIAIYSKEDFKDWTKSDYRMVTKRFYRWLRNQEFVKDIKTGGAEETVGPEDILDERELTSLFGCCTILRDKAAGGRSLLDAVAIELRYPDKLQVRDLFPVDLVEKVTEDLGSLATTSHPIKRTS